MKLCTKCLRMVKDAMNPKKEVSVPQEAVV